MSRSLIPVSILALALALLIGNAHASNRETFTGEILRRVQKVDGGVDSVRLYLNHRLVVKRSTPLGSNTTVDGSVDTVTRGVERKDVISRGAAGKIVEISEFQGTPILWVSFDTSCTVRACAWGFLSYGGHFFGLAALPEQDATGMQVDALWLGYKPLFFRRMETDPYGHWRGGWNQFIYNALTTKTELRLQVKLDELREVEHQTVNHGGWGN